MVLQTLTQSVITSFRDFIFPPLCFVCEKRLENGSLRVCVDCWSSFRPFIIGDPVWHELKNRFEEEGVVNDFLSCFYFEKEGRLQDVLHLLKYRSMKSMGVMLGRDIEKKILQHKEFSTADYLVPVPLHKLKQRERGYNQSEMICKGISEVARIPVKAKLIRRIKYTESQTQLNVEERKENVGNAFEVPPKYVEEIRGKAIILVDDVITTGSTINACARALIDGGAKAVLAASAAVAR